MSEPILDLHELTARYFDGELSEAEEPAALEHLASCEKCQAELGDLVGMEVALRRPAAVLAGGSAPSVPAPSDPAPSVPESSQVLSLEQAREKRARVKSSWLVPAGVIGAVAAAAVVLMSVRVVRRDREDQKVQVALAPTRSAEVRFSSPSFDQYRPYEVVRGASGKEDIPLAVLAELEKRKDRAALAAAQALRGEVAQAKAAVLAAPESPQRDADLAAAELLAGHPELALDAADRALQLAPGLTAAQWNRALALRELGLSLTAATAFEEVSRGREAGWADEATSKAAALRAAMADRGPRAQAFTAAARAMVDHAGPPLGDRDAAARPGLSRLYFHDALRTAATAEQARSLAPLAAALDRAAGNDLASRAVEKAAAADFAVRAPLAMAYRDLQAGRAPGTAPSLLAKLATAKTYVGDLRLGLVMANRGLVPAAEVIALIEATGDPWFLLHVPRERASALLVDGAADRAETELLGGLAGCDERLWAFRCARMAYDLTMLYVGRTRYAEAEGQALHAIELFRASGATELEDSLLSPLAEVLRTRGRYALSKATFREVMARLGDTDCNSVRYAASGIALLSIYRSASLGDSMPPLAEDCGAPPLAMEVGGFVDLALMTGNVDDRARAEQWIAASAKSTDPALVAIAEISKARLEIEKPDSAATLRAALPKLSAEEEPSASFRAWIYQTLVDDAARRGAWADALALVAEDLGAPAPTSCALAVSLDDTRGAAVALGKAGAPSGARSSVKAPPDWTGEALVPANLRDAFAGCERIAVLARPPLQGRTDLLPPELPWFFASGRAALTAPSTKPPRRELFIGDALPPPALALPALAPMPPHPAAPELTELRGPAATPASVVAALADATYAELHVHGQVDLGVADASFLALSPGPDQRWALTAAEVRAAKLTAAPVIVLAACRAATVAPFEHKRWSLPDAFLAAGARAVIAPTVEIPDAEAVTFFAELRARLTAGEEPAAALAALRKAYVAKGSRWAADVILFN